MVVVVLDGHQKLDQPKNLMKIIRLMFLKFSFYCCHTRYTSSPSQRTTKHSILCKCLGVYLLLINETYAKCKIVDKSILDRIIIFKHLPHFPDLFEFLQISCCCCCCFLFKKTPYHEYYFQKSINGMNFILT